MSVPLAVSLPMADHQHPTPRPNAGEQPSARHGWQRGFAHAWMVLGAAPAGLGLGWLIDRAYGTAPWWMLGLSVLFLGASLYPLIKDALK